MNTSTPDKCPVHEICSPGCFARNGAGISPHHPSPEKEVSQEQPTYIDQVVEEFRGRFYTHGGLLPQHRDGGKILASEVETFLREKLEECFALKDVLDAHERGINFGKTAERQRIREIVEKERIEGARLFDIGSEFACPRDYRREGNNALIDRLLSRLDEGESTP